METDKMERKTGRGIRYLTEEEKKKTRALWRECFPEDAREENVESYGSDPAEDTGRPLDFISYYYAEKTKENRILAKLEEDTVIAMLHRNPYRIRWQSVQWNVDYIVGVATRTDRRHEGHMREVLTRCLRDMNREHMPFTFLMPAAEAIYRPFSFRYVEAKEEMWLREQDRAGLKQMEVKENREDCQKAGMWMMRWLEERYEMSTIRDASYVRALIRELKSENGSLSFLMDRDACVGLQAFWGVEKREQRILYTEDIRCQRGKKQPRIMARITNAEAFLSAVRLEGEGEAAIRLDLADGQIPENNGRFLWRLSAEGSTLKTDLDGKKDEMEEAPVLKADIGELTEWLFGWKSAREIWKDCPESLEETLIRIHAVDGIFLDEIV